MDNARQIAYDILNQADSGRRTLDQWLDAAAPRLHALSRADRALVHALVYGTLRWQGRLDYMIDRLSRKPGKVDPRVRTILRMALFQICHFDRVPVRAAVHSAVELAKHNDRRWAAGFVNGVLRRAAADPDGIDWPDDSSDPDLALSVRNALPRWLAARWIGRWGWDEARKLGEALNSIPPVTIRTNTLKTDRAALLAALSKETRHIQPTHFTPEGIVLSAFERPLAEWPAYRRGWFQVQDEAAQLVGHLVAPRPGETVWDACAGLGTKTAHLAQLMSNKGTIIATDRHPRKLKQLQSEIERLGIAIVRPMPLDLEKEISTVQLPIFDRILVDAPCSGLGVIQKNPDTKWHISDRDLQRHSHRQLALLTRSAECLRVGGTLVYAVCSMEPEETEAVVEGFLQKRNDFAIHEPAMADVTAVETIISAEGYLRTFPHRHDMDGFFAAALVKTSQAV